MLFFMLSSKNAGLADGSKHEFEEKKSIYRDKETIHITKSRKPSFLNFDQFFLNMRM